MSYESQPKNLEVLLRTRSAQTLIIDPGHGGLDGGASAADGTRESELNLEIAGRTYLLAQLFGVPVRITRSSEALDYPAEYDTIREKKVWDQKRRADLINSVPNGVLLSIHQNNYPDRRPRGTQVLYAATPGSKELGELAHALLIRQLCPENRRVAAPISESIYLMREARCPAILVECGFLSNPEEAALLRSDRYQTELSTVLIAACINYMD